MKGGHAFIRRFNPWLLHAGDALMDRKYGTLKRRAFALLPERVVEIGPGAGANFRYYRPRSEVIAFEPNPFTHDVLKEQAARYGLSLDLRAVGAESLDLDSADVDGVVGTLVLCTVEDPERVVSEIFRVLRPGGRYVFLEHVSAPEASSARALQRLLRRPWRWLFDGCTLNRDTHALLWRAGFSRLEMDCLWLGPPFLPVAPHIFGTAVK